MSLLFSNNIDTRYLDATFAKVPWRLQSIQNYNKKHDTWMIDIIHRYIIHTTFPCEARISQKVYPGLQAQAAKLILNI